MTDEALYFLDNYGSCDRGPDCYWGKDPSGNFNGCLKMGWRGRACPYWKPLGALDHKTLKAAQEALERLQKNPPISKEEWAEQLSGDLSKFTD